MQRADSLEKTLTLGIEGRKRGQQGMGWLDDITDSVDMSLSKLQVIDGEGQGSLACCSPWGHKESDKSDMTDRLNINNNHFPHFKMEHQVSFKVSFKISIKM